MLRYDSYTRDRIRQLVERLRNKIYHEARPVAEILVSPPAGRISRAEAMRLEYRPTQVGEQFGPIWTTYWFKVRAIVPSEWRGGRVDLLWMSHSEATLWVDDQPRQGLNFEPTSGDRSVRPDALLLNSAAGGETLEFEIEMACNQVFGLDPGDKAHNYLNVSRFVLDRCDLGWFDAEAWDLYHDLVVLQMLEAESVGSAKDLELAWAGRLLHELNRVANGLDPDDRTTWAAAKEIARGLYENHNGTYVHELSAIGHAHIDTAWLWPLAETYRKCVRSFSSQLTYMERYPEFRFSCSQAQQYAWIKERAPELYARIGERVRSGQWVPVGGTWIEPDCNLPSGESLARQFLYGQRFFQREFGRTCREFWNPDVFGYNGQLPQIMRQSGITRFLTQKLSWNRFNKPGHHTFTWQGIDGSEVLTHFPPADTYNALTLESGRTEILQLRDNARHYKDHVRSRHSLMLFGYGDGGGGPTPRMLEVFRRVGDLQGVPRTTQRSSDEFFDLLEKDADPLPVLVGELYFEFHRGTYTSQAATKRGNRKAEWLLHDIEFLATAAARLRGAPYPRTELASLWEVLLLNQFHDILPGSSIGLVYEDAARDYAAIQSGGERLRAAALQALPEAATGEQAVPINTLGFARREIVEAPDKTLVCVEAPSYGAGVVVQTNDQVRVTVGAGQIALENAHLRAVLAEDGSLLSLIEKTSGREALSAPGNRFDLYDDHPTVCDAWDVDPFYLETRQSCEPASGWKVILETPLRAEFACERTVGVASRMWQRVRLDAGARRLEFHTRIDWHEAHKFFKVAFPTSVRAMNATYEMQYGCVERPTHHTNSFDLAKYEVPMHKWADLSEHGFGVALLSESKYGFHTSESTMHLSLLRAPKHPDPEADMGRHEFAYALMPHADGWREAGVVAEAHRFNVPVVWAVGRLPAHSLAVCDDANLVLDTIKLAEDSVAVVVRLYECHGARGIARVRLGWPVAKAVFCNFLEEDGEHVTLAADGTLEMPYTPFQIITLKAE